MQAMTSSQLEKLVPMLEQDDLVQGLNYFTQDSLLELMKHIPKEELVKTVMEMFSQEQVIEFMPEKELDNVLTDFDTDKERILENLKSIPEIQMN